MMAPAYEENPVQAFPIHSETFIGTASDLSCANKSVIHVVVDGDITFNFKGGSSLTISALAGEDFGITRDVSTINSTGDVWIS